MVYGPNAVSIRVANVVQTFQVWKFLCIDEYRSGRPVTDKISAIFKKVEQDRHISSHDIAEELNVDHRTVLRHLRKFSCARKVPIKTLIFGYCVISLRKT